MSPELFVSRIPRTRSVLSPTLLHPSFTKAHCPFSVLARFEGDKVAYVRFLEDSYGTAGLLKTRGVTRFHSDPAGNEVEV
jgi:hypothetical protein